MSADHGARDPDGAGGELADVLADVIPALAARLRASGLAELEVRTAAWRVRVRRDVPSDGSPPTARGVRGTALTGAGQRAGPGPGPAPAPRERTDVASSPAVGYFVPDPAAEAGRRVRGGDLLGHVEMLGIHHDVPAPQDGVIIRLLASSGQAVEYGQPLVIVEPGPIRAPDVAASVGD